MSDRTRHALLVHGLGSSSASWWRLREALEVNGWQVLAPDARGHGRAARESVEPTEPADAHAGFDGSLGAYAAELLAHRAPDGRPWDLVVGHSLGGATASLAANADRGWAERLVLLDPVLHLPDELRAAVRESELGDLALTIDAIRAGAPHWDERDVAAKVEGLRGTSAGVVAATIDDNDPWDVRAALAAASVRCLVLGGDPAVFTLCPPQQIATVLAARPTVRYTPVVGAGHAPHRDRPAETVAALLEWAQAPTT